MPSLKEEAAAGTAFALRTLRRFFLLASTLVGVILASCWLATLLSLNPREAPAAAIDGPFASPTPMTSFSMYSVGNTGGVGVYIRNTPRLVDQIRAWGDGTLIQQVGPDVEEEGILWHEVRDPDGNIGYVPAAYLLPTGELLPR